MAAYATASDVQARMLRTLSAEELVLCATLLDDAADKIDLTGTTASNTTKARISCAMVIRCLGDGQEMSVPLGATQGSMSALGYSQSWTIGAGGAVGQLYLSKSEKIELGVGNRAGSYSPIEELVPAEDSEEST